MSDWNLYFRKTKETQAKKCYLGWFSDQIVRGDGFFIVKYGKKFLPHCARHNSLTVLLFSQMILIQWAFLEYFFICETDSILIIIKKSKHDCTKMKGNHITIDAEKPFKKPLFLKDGPLKTLFPKKNLARRPVTSKIY